MLKTLASLALTVGMINSSIASEKTISTELICTSPMGLEQVLEKHKEEPFLTAISVRNLDGKLVAMSTVMFINSKTKSWTLVEKINENLYCVSAMGEHIAPYIEESDQKNKY